MAWSRKVSAKAADVSFASAATMLKRYAQIGGFVNSVSAKFSMGCAGIVFNFTIWGFCEFPARNLGVVRLFSAVVSACGVGKVLMLNESGVRSMQSFRGVEP